jgi:hypothetical protein
MRVLIAGWRGPTDRPGATEAHRHVVWQELTMLRLRYSNERLVIAHGRCPSGGVDLFAQQWVDSSRAYNCSAEPHPADWRRHGAAAGPIRNTEMVELGADLCLAFPGPGSTGTWDCVRKAVAAGIRTIIIGLKGESS